jgi:hypothetical protein
VVSSTLNIADLGLSLTALLPAAAWHFSCCVSFFARPGEKRHTGN